MTCLYLYISKSWSVVFIVATLLLSYIIHLFFTTYFLFLNFYSPYSKKKNLLLPVSPHLLLHFLQHFPSLFASLSPHYSQLFRYTSFIIFSFLYFDSSSPYFILYKFDIISSIQSVFFPKKIVSTLSLSLSLLVDFCSFL